MQRKEWIYLQVLILPAHFGAPLLPSCFCLFISSTFSLASSSFQVEEKKKKNKEKKSYKRKKNVEKEGSLPFFSHFYIWDEALLLFSSLRIFSTLNSPPSSSLVSHISSKLCATQPLEMEWVGNEVREVGGGR
jgi:hypothetical protein